MHLKSDVAVILRSLDLGDSIAENDEILWKARVETSVFSDLLEDRVDLIPGTKGSGKSALFRIFSDFLPDHLLERKKVAVAHGVYSHGDSVFQAFQEEFDRLSEDQFVDFWCIYLTKIAYIDFVSSERYRAVLSHCRKQVDDFKKACHEAGIEEVERPKSFRALIEAVIETAYRYCPSLSFDPADNSFSLEPNLDPRPRDRGRRKLPRYMDSIKYSLDEILKRAGLRLWLMVDRLDELFPRRSDVETRALRGLLRSMREFSSKRIILKLFVRDDILSQVSRGGFTALTHVTSRRADRLRWSEDQIMALIVKRFFANKALCDLLKVKNVRFDDKSSWVIGFNLLFPDTVAETGKGKKRTPTLKWICDHVKDGQEVVTPRDVIELLSKARQFEQDECNKDPYGETDVIIGEKAIRYGYEELSRHKKETLLKAEFPHLWPIMELFEMGRSEYDLDTLVNLIGPENKRHLEDLLNIGFLSKKPVADTIVFSVPHVYRECLEITNGRSSKSRRSGGPLGRE